MIRLVLCDIDNTLVPLGEPAATEHAIAAVHALLDAGVAFGPATGRDLDGLERFFRGDGACYATGLVSNGKLIYLDGRLVNATYLDRGAVERLFGFVAPLADSFALVRCGGVDYACGATPEALRGSADVIGTDVVPLDRVPDGDIVACTVACLGDERRNRWLVESLAGICPTLELLSPVTGYYDVVPLGWNKANAMGRLCDIMGISPDEVCAFGDSENDVPLLRAAGVSVAVSNAMPAAAGAARYHTGPCAEDAVAAALLDIAEAARTGGTPAFMGI